jgi:hypothetical protein
VSNGHPVLCLPTGGRGGKSNLFGGAVIETDPAVESAGADVGFAPAPDQLRAPDVSVGNIPDAPGWVRGVPLLAVEFADVGQDEEELQRKIRELLAAGTRVLWVVRLVGPRRVEVYEAGRPLRVVNGDGELSAPGILRNAVPVAALYDRDAAHRAQLRNLLMREGYESIDDVRLSELRAQLRRALARRGFAVSPEQSARIDRCTDRQVLERWMDLAVTATSSDEVFAEALAKDG